MAKESVEFLFINIPQPLVSPIKKAVLRGLKAAREKLNWKSKLSIAIVYNKGWAPGPGEYPDYYQAIPMPPSGIMISLNLSRHNVSAMKKEVKNIAKSVVHEVVHIINSKPSRETKLIEFIIMEGLAEYVSQKILKMNDYEPGDKNDAKLALKEMRKKLFDNTNQVMEAESHKYESPYDTHVFYGVGYTIISEYHKKNPELSLLDVANVPLKTLTKFAQDNFLK